MLIFTMRSLSTNRPEEGRANHCAAGCGLPDKAGYETNRSQFELSRDTVLNFSLVPSTL
jgi:hypothetical protein